MHVRMILSILRQLLHTMLVSDPAIAKGVSQCLLEYPRFECELTLVKRRFSLALIQILTCYIERRRGAVRVIPQE